MGASRRAVGIVRVSHVGDRGGESFASPGEQRDRIQSACKRDRMQLVDTLDELDVSDGAPVVKRDGLRAAVEAIEAGHADVVVAAYFDRLVRSLKVQAELVERVEVDGGQVVALDTGQVTNGSAGQWLSATMLGAVSEYHRRSTGDRVRQAHIRAVERGAWPGRVPPGYVRLRADGVLEPDPQTAPVVAEAFELRAGGASVDAVRGYLRDHGVKLSPHGVQRPFASKVVLGHIYFGELVRLDAHPAIVDAATWKRVQGVSASRGRQAKSERLLARLGVLRCATCDARMTVNNTQQGAYASYRCPNRDCRARAGISARLVEELVTDAVKAALEDVQGRAEAHTNALGAERALQRAQAELDALIEILDPLEFASRRRLTDATAKRDEARETLERLGGARTAVNVGVEDWDALTLGERRALIHATVARVAVAPGRGVERVSVELL